MLLYITHFFHKAIKGFSSLFTHIFQITHAPNCNNNQTKWQFSVATCPSSRWKVQPGERLSFLWHSWESGCHYNVVKCLRETVACASMLLCAHTVKQEFYFIFLTHKHNLHLPLPAVLASSVTLSSSSKINIYLKELARAISPLTH